MGDKYKVFKEEDSQEVFDVFEEKLRISLEELNLSMEEELDPYEGLDMIRKIIVNRALRIFFQKICCFRWQNWSSWNAHTLRSLTERESQKYICG